MKETESSLRDLQHELADIIEPLPDATFVIDKNGKMIFWNREMVKLNGAPAEEILGMNYSEYAWPFYKGI